MDSERTIKEIRWDDDYIEDTDLSILSGIEILEFEEVKSVWDLMEDSSLVSILSRLKILADTNISFDYSMENITLACSDNVFTTYDSDGTLAVYAILS